VPGEKRRRDVKKGRSLLRGIWEKKATLRLPISRNRKADEEVVSYEENGSRLYRVRKKWGRGGKRVTCPLVEGHGGESNGPFLKKTH